jgi:hypothetical protein
MESWGDKNSCRLITPSFPASYAESGIPQGQVLIGMPPICFDDFKPGHLESVDNSIIQEEDLVHIGNFKQTYYAKNDPVLIGLIGFTNKNRVKVWGNGWEGKINSALIMGSLHHSLLQSVYLKTTVSVGIMHSYQRDFTFPGDYGRLHYLDAQLLLNKCQMNGFIIYLQVY